MLVWSQAKKILFMHGEFSSRSKLWASSTQIGALHYVSDSGCLHAMQVDSQIANDGVCQITAEDLVDELMLCSTHDRFIHVPGGDVTAWLWTADALRDSQRFGRKKSINLRSVEELWSVVREWLHWGEPETVQHSTWIYVANTSRHQPSVTERCCAEQLLDFWKRS